MIRHRVRIISALLCVPALWVGRASGAITSSIKTSSSAASFHAQIKGFIDAQVAQLSGNDAAAQKTAREALISNSENTVGLPASAQYQIQYAKDLTDALAPLLKPTSTLRIRLNAAVVAGNVARSIHKTNGVADNFESIAKQLLSDKEPALALWGVKTAKYAVADLAQKGARVPLAGLVVKAVEDHPTSEAILEEGYSTLALETPDAPAPGFASVLPDLLDLIEWRALQYQKADLPPAPLAEQSITVFLSVTEYAVVTANQRTTDQTFKALGNITCATMRSVANGNTSAEAIEMVRKYGEAFEAFGEQLPDATLQASGKAITLIGAAATPDQIGKCCDGLTAALKAKGVVLSQPGM